ncbi:hypothetical protein Tco_1309400 [Tanacetum coccineum]
MLRGSPLMKASRSFSVFGTMFGHRTFPVFTTGVPVGPMFLLGLAFAIVAACASRAVGESLNIQDVKTKLFLEFGKFTSHDEELMESYYSRFYKIINEMIKNNLTVATMQVNYQKEVNEIRAERIAKNTNPLALVAAAQQYPDPYYQAPKSHKSYAPPSKQSSSTRSNASTKYKGKEIAKPITPLFESASEEDSDS